MTTSVYYEREIEYAGVSRAAYVTLKIVPSFDALFSPLVL
jgi:hypothetical protein